MKFTKRNRRYRTRPPTRNRITGWLWVALLLVAAPLTTDALILGQLDDFQDGTTLNWGTGSGPADNIANGGPAGAGDNFLQYTSSGTGGTDSRLIVFNSSQWQGDYNGAGITSIGVDLNNLGSQTLAIRLAFFVSRTSGFVTTTPFALASGSGWQHATFTLAPADFTTVGSPGNFTTLLSNFTGQLRILSSSSPSLLGDTISGTLGIDNVHAIPEPNTFVMVGLGLLSLALAVHARNRLHPCCLPVRPVTSKLRTPPPPLPDERV